MNTITVTSPLLPNLQDLTDPYKDYPSAAQDNLLVATKIADQVICLLMHHAWSEVDVERVINVIL